MYRVIILALLFALLARFAYKLGVSNKVLQPDGRGKRREKSSSTRVFLIWGIFTMKLLKIRKKKACEDILEYKGHSWRGETYKNFQVKGRLQDQSECRLREIYILTVSYRVYGLK